MIEYLTDAVRHIRSPVDIDHAVAAMQIPLSLIDAMGESASVVVVGTAIMSTIESVLQVYLVGTTTFHPPSGHGGRLLFRGHHSV